jgi:hypothetical protein
LGLVNQDLEGRRNIELLLGVFEICAVRIMGSGLSGSGSIGRALEHLGPDNQSGAGPAVAEGFVGRDRWMPLRSSRSYVTGSRRNAVIGVFSAPGSRLGTWKVVVLDLHGGNCWDVRIHRPDGAEEHFVSVGDQRTSENVRMTIERELL